MIIIHILKADIFWSMGMVLDFLKCGCGGHRNFVSMWHNLGHSFIHLVLPHPLEIEGVEIERIGNRFPTKSFKLVGVHLDDNLNWNEHTSHVRGKLSKTNYGLARAKKNPPSHI